MLWHMADKGNESFPKAQSGTHKHILHKKSKQTAVNGTYRSY